MCPPHAATRSARDTPPLHFDLAHRAVKFFVDTEDLRTIIEEELAAMIPEDEQG